MADTLVIIPTYNEKENITAIINAVLDLGDDFNLLSTVVKIGEQIYHIYAFDNYNGTGKFHEIDRVLEGNPKTLTQDEKQKIYEREQRRLRKSALSNF